MCFKAVKKHIADSMFEPLGYEIEFSENSPLGCIKINTKDNEFKLFIKKVAINISKAYIAVFRVEQDLDTVRLRFL